MYVGNHHNHDNLEWESTIPLVIPFVIMSLMIPFLFLVAGSMIYIYFIEYNDYSKIDSAIIFILICVLLAGGTITILFYPKEFVYIWNIKRMTYREFQTENGGLMYRIMHGLEIKGISTVECSSSKHSIWISLEKKEISHKFCVEDSSISILVSKTIPYVVNPSIRIFVGPIRKDNSQVCQNIQMLINKVFENYQSNRTMN